MHASACGSHDLTNFCLQLPEPLIGRDVSLAEFKSPGTKAVVICFICNHCPFVLNLLGEHPASSHCRFSICDHLCKQAAMRILCCVCSSHVQRSHVLQMAYCSWQMTSSHREFLSLPSAQTLKKHTLRHALFGQ